MEMTVIDMLLIIISLLLINQAQKTNKRVTACSYTVHVSASHAVLYKYKLTKCTLVYISKQHISFHTQIHSTVHVELFVNLYCTLLLYILTACLLIIIVADIGLPTC